MSISSLIPNQRGIALFNMVFVLIFIGVLAVGGVKMYGSIVERGKLNASRGELENHVKVITAWAVRNGRLPTAGEFPEVFGGTPPVDNWGRPIAYVYDNTLAAANTGGLCGRTDTPLKNNNVSLAFALVSGGNDYTIQTTANGAPVNASMAAIAVVFNQLDIFRAVPLEEMKSKAGCYGPTGGRLSIINNELPSVCSGSSTYTATLFPNGGVGGYTWALVASPPWLAVNSATGALSPVTSITGTAGTYPITVSLKDSHSPTANTVQRTYNLKVMSCSSDPLQKFRDFVKNENVFVFGTKFLFSGNTVNGPNATAVVTGGSTQGDFNGGASIGVSNIYIDATKKDSNGNEIGLETVTLGGSQELGSSTTPGKVYINGNLELSGSAKIYGTEIYVSGTVKMSGSPVLGLSNKTTRIYINGDLNLPNGTVYGTEVHVNGSAYLKSTTIGGNVYLYGNLTLDWTPSLQGGSHVYYRGTIAGPKSLTDDKLTYVPNSSIQPVVMPAMTLDYAMPSLRDPSWYEAKGYDVSNSSTELNSNEKIFFTGDYSPDCSSYRTDYTVKNVIVVSTGDITINQQGSCKLTGVFFAPAGLVTFKGDSFEGLVIAKEGFNVSRGGTQVTFKNISNYISNPDDYPF